jgi:hypothetical protein
MFAITQLQSNHLTLKQIKFSEVNFDDNILIKLAKL